MLNYPFFLLCALPILPMLYILYSVPKHRPCRRRIRWELHFIKKIPSGNTAPKQWPLVGECCRRRRRRRRPNNRGSSEIARVIWFAQKLIKNNKFSLGMQPIKLPWMSNEASGSDRAHGAHLVRWFEGAGRGNNHPDDKQLLAVRNDDWGSGNFYWICNRRITIHC